MKRIKLKNIQNLIVCTLFLYIVTLMDTLTYGRSVFTKTNDLEIINIGIYIYFYGTFISQILFNVFTKIESGLMASIIVENYYISRKIYTACQSTDIVYTVTNCLLCCALSTLLFSFILFGIKFSKLYVYCNYIPKPIFTGCLFFIGFIQLETGYKIVSDSYISLILSAILFLIFIYYEFKYPDLPYLIILLCFIAISGFYVFIFTINGIFYKYTISELLSLCREKNIICENTSVDLKPTFILQYISFSKIDKQLIIRNIKHIISMAIFSTIHFAECYPIFKDLSGKEFTFENEIQAQALTNLFTTFTCYPSYFIASDSYAFLKSGAHFRSYGILASIPLLSIIFTGPLLNKYIPKCLLGGIPMFISIYFIFPALQDFKKSTKLEYLVALTIPIGLYFIELQIIPLVLALCLFIIISQNKIYECKNKNKEPFEIIERLRHTHIIIRVLQFTNLKTLNDRLNTIFINKNKEYYYDNIEKNYFLIDLEHSIDMDRISREYIIDIPMLYNIEYIFIGNKECKIIKDVEKKEYPNVTVCYK